MFIIEFEDESYYSILGVSMDAKKKEISDSWKKRFGSIQQKYMGVKDKEKSKLNEDEKKIIAEYELAQEIKNTLNPSEAADVSKDKKVETERDKYNKKLVGPTFELKDIAPDFLIKKHDMRKFIEQMFYKNFFENEKITGIPISEIYKVDFAEDFAACDDCTLLNDLI
ncbi:MAG: hypothetical protein ACD_59C00077G0003 [uncultured bacterium]|nr:MAG: hypothetical protein ACD_59C00077G0003 [uncultured bacterium]